MVCLPPKGSHLSIPSFFSINLVSEHGHQQGLNWKTGVRHARAKGECAKDDDRVSRSGLICMWTQGAIVSISGQISFSFIFEARGTRVNNTVGKDFPKHLGLEVQWMINLRLPSWIFHGTQEMIQQYGSIVWCSILTTKEHEKNVKWPWLLFIWKGKQINGGSG